MEYFILVVTGLLMGLFGGMLGIGGSVVMIPALTVFMGENQHLYQAAAMICNFFVSASSLVAHRKAEVFVGGVLRRIIPAAVVGIVCGVALSNLDMFSGDKSYLLARIFGLFLVYVGGYNFVKLLKGRKSDANPNRAWIECKGYRIISMMIGMVTGVGAGLLGIGAGTIATPLQQVWLKMPLRRAMSNSAATIASIALIGACFKNLTLARHDLEMMDSIKIAVIVAPTAIVGGLIGGQLMHWLPIRLVRAVFVGVLLLSAYKLLTVT